MGFARSIVKPNLLPRGVLRPASLLPEFRSALFPLRPLARHLMPVVPFGGIFAAGSLNVHCAGFYPAYELPDSLFYDTDYHLTYEGVIHRTNMLIANIDSLGIISH